jgi:hypothetical protein
MLHPENVSRIMGEYLEAMYELSTGSQMDANAQIL